jgi:hypothetical protein
LKRLARRVGGQAHVWPKQVQRIKSCRCSIARLRLCQMPEPPQSPPVHVSDTSFIESINTPSPLGNSLRLSSSITEALGALGTCQSERTSKPRGDSVEAGVSDVVGKMDASRTSPHQNASSIPPGDGPRREIAALREAGETLKQAHREFSQLVRRHRLPPSLRERLDALDASRSMQASSDTPEAAACTGASEQGNEIQRAKRVTHRESPVLSAASEGASHI